MTLETHIRVLKGAVYRQTLGNTTSGSQICHRRPRVPGWVYPLWVFHQGYGGKFWQFQEQIRLFIGLGRVERKTNYTFHMCLMEPVLPVPWIGLDMPHFGVSGGEFRYIKNMDFFYFAVFAVKFITYLPNFWGKPFYL